MAGLQMAILPVCSVSAIQIIPVILFLWDLSYWCLPVSATANPADRMWKTPDAVIPASIRLHMLQRPIRTIAVLKHLAGYPYLNAARGIVVGQSFGGATAIALSAREVPGMVAAVNFAGGGGGDPVGHPGVPCSAYRMTAMFRSYGTTAKVPTLWLYSENDQFWGKNPA
jgi:predicted peptidase